VTGVLACALPIARDERPARSARDRRVRSRAYRQGPAAPMNGMHDLGGMHGFGPVDPEPNEPVFHHEWERRAFALNLATGFLGRWNIDMGRYAREHMPPAEYLATTYYEHWLYGLERLLVETGLAAATELETMRRLGPGPVKALGPADVPKALRNRRAARVEDRLAAPRFK